MLLDWTEYSLEQYNFSTDEEFSFSSAEIPTDTFTGIEFGLFPSTEIQENNSIPSEDKDLIKNTLFSVSILTSQIPELKSSVLISGGQTSDTSSWLGSVGSAISGFASGITSTLSGIGNWIGEKAGEAVDWVKGAGSWVIDNAGKGIDSFIQDPLGSIWNANKAIAEKIYNIGTGVGGKMISVGGTNVGEVTESIKHI
jgi:hypothetical protein